MQIVGPLDDASMCVFFGLKDVYVEDPKVFIDKLKELSQGLVVQAVDARFVAGPLHLELVAKQMVEAQRRGLRYAENPNLDLIVRITCDLQIRRAVSKAGLRKGRMDIVVIGIGERSMVTRFAERVKGMEGVSQQPLALTPRKKRFLMKYHGVSSRSLKAAIGEGEMLAIALAEKAALLYSMKT